MALIRRIAFGLTVAAAAWSLAISVWMAVARYYYYYGYNYFSPAFVDLGRAVRPAIGLVLLFFLPNAISFAALWGLRTSRSYLLPLAALALLGFCAVGAFFGGVLYLPAAAFLVVAAALHLAANEGTASTGS